MTDKKFGNQVALVTGGGSGIGSTIALRLAKEGAQVVIIGRNEKTLQETSDTHKNIYYEVADVGNSDELIKAVNKIKSKFGRLDILVNNAGVAPVTPLIEVEMKEFDDTFRTNVRGVVDITRLTLPMLLESKGNIINISSTVANVPLPNMSIYSSSKAAVYALTRSWAKEFATYGLRVNSIAVGPIDTPIYEKTDLSEEEAQKHRENILKLIPLNHFGQPADVASVVSFLASEESKFITGADYTVDGGVTA